MTPITSLREEAEEPPLHPNHLPDLRYVLMVLEKARKHQPFDKQERQELEAAITGMRYIIKRTEESSHPEYRSSGERGEADTAGVPGMVTTPSAHAAEALRLSGNAGVGGNDGR